MLEMIIQIIFKIIFSLFAIMGILEAYRAFLFWLLKTKNQGNLFLVVSISGHEEDAEAILRNAAEKIQWMHGKNACVVCLDRGMDQETRKICEMICTELPCITLCKQEDIGRIIAP